MQTEQRYLSDQEKAETDMSASAGSSMSRTAVRMAVTAASGGDVIFEVDEGLNTLQDFRHIAKNSAAKDGETGRQETLPW